MSFDKMNSQNQALGESQCCANLYSATQHLSNSHALNFLKNIFFLFSLIFVLGACSLEASVTSLAQLTDIENFNRKDPDFIHGDVVTSGSYKITGVFGEVSEKTKAINNSEWEIKGVFYE